MREKTKFTKGGSWHVFSLFCLGVIALYLFALDLPLVGPDEPRYAQVAREMYLRGDWVTPTLAGSNWFEKPVLLYWLQIVSYQLFGINEFAARFGSAVLGLLTIGCLWLVGRVVDGSSIIRSSHSFASLLTFMSATTLSIIVFSRGASFDIVVTFTITASLTAFFLADKRESHRRMFALLAMYAFLGLGLLAKGLIGVVFPAGIIFFYFAIRRRLPNTALMLSPLWGLPVMIFVAGFWYLPMYNTHGWSFVDEFFVQHHFQRFTSNKYQHPQPFYFYLWVLPLMTLPWLPFAAVGLWRSVSAVVKRNEVHEPSLILDLSALGLCWVVVPTVFFSFSGSKLPGYILPAVPGALCLVAVSANSLLDIGGRWRSVITATGIITLATVFLLLVFVFPQYADKDSVRPLITASTALGHGDLEIYPLQTLSHNSEFYAPGRLPRDTAGKQRRFESTSQIVETMRASQDHKALIITPGRHATDLRSDPDTEFTEISSNGKLTIILVSLK